MNETKQQKFERIAERRVTEAIKKLKLIGNLSERKNYEYTEEHVHAIISAIEGEFRAMKSRFRVIDDEKSGRFSFKKKVA